jgi:arabinogalactan oligomer/maltooligosaccharide transport system substrate-binding protein
MNRIWRTRRSYRATWLPLIAGLLLVSVLAACGNEEQPAADQAAGDPVVEAAAGGQQAGGQQAGGDAAAQATADAGGGGAVVQQAPASTPTAEPSGRIVLWHSWGSGDGDALATILTSFQAKYPQVTVDTLFVADTDLPKAYADGVLAGSGPDMVLAPTWWLSDFVDLGVVQQLDLSVDQATLDGYWPAAVDNLRWNGQLYGLPTDFELVSLFVNTALAPGGAPGTTADMLAQAQAAPTQGTGLYNSLYHLFWGLPAYGGRLFDDNGAVVLDQGGDVAGYLAWLRQMSQTQGSYVDTDYGMLLDRFKKGEFAYFVDGPWAIDELSAALGSNLVVTSLPAGPSGPAQPWLHAGGVMLNPRSSPEQQQLALVFAEHLTNADSGAVLASQAKRLPANRNAVIGDNPLLQGFMNQAATAQSMPNRPEMEEVWGYAGDMVVKVVDGNADPTTTVQETAALINEANGK